jgi:hypothetical protein
MRRREFIASVGGAAVAWPLTARAQKAMPVVGYLSSLGQAVSVHFDAAFRRGLSQMGYVEGQNVSIEYRWISDSYDPLPAMAADLVQRQVAVICCVWATGSARGQSRDNEHPYRLCHWRRPAQIRLCRQL